MRSERACNTVLALFVLPSGQILVLGEVETGGGTFIKPARTSVASTRVEKWAVRPKSLELESKKARGCLLSGSDLRFETLPYVVSLRPARKDDDQDGGLIRRASNNSSMIRSLACGSG